MSSLSNAIQHAGARRPVGYSSEQIPKHAPLVVAILGLLIALTACRWQLVHCKETQPRLGLNSNPTQQFPLHSVLPPSWTSTRKVLVSDNSQKSCATAPTSKNVRPWPSGSKIRSTAVRINDATDAPNPHRDVLAVQRDALISAQLAYEAYQTGDFNLAGSRYREVLMQEPRNSDVMNALGIISLRAAQPDVAEHYFREALVVNPKDPTAMSQLTLLYAEGDPTAAESRLRTLVVNQPNSSIAHFSLGNTLLRQKRWGEAQQSFFQAYALDDTNPDILYNLAISLDQLRQRKLARQYYLLAIQATSKRPASFNPDAAKVRAQAIATALDSATK